MFNLLSPSENHDGYKQGHLQAKERQNLHSLYLISQTRLAFYYRNGCNYGIFAQNSSMDSLIGWCVVCLGFNGSLEQYFCLYRAVSQRQRENKRENMQTTSTAPAASTADTCLNVIKISRQRKLPSIITRPDPTRPDHPYIAFISDFTEIIVCFDFI